LALKSGKNGVSHFTRNRTGIHYKDIYRKWLGGKLGIRRLSTWDLRVLIKL
jgi:hypothetical protein